MKIYIVDDDKSIRFSLREVLEDEDYNVDVFATGKTMLKSLARERPALILLDVWMGKEDGLDILDKIREIYSTLPVLMISGHGTIEQAVTATKKGAIDFLEKPLSLEDVLSKIAEILQIEPERKSTKELDNIHLKSDEIIGESPEILEVKKSIALAAGTNARVFIYGANGTGKELVARAIYRNSKRASKAFVEINCAAIPEDLIESELFGHQKGAFTGASEQHIGKFELADGGTLFLDEICDMSLATQARVLRALQEQRFTRVGGSDNINVDVRIIAATNYKPEEAIADGRFREDLYYRLNVIDITIPSLKQRVADIPLLLDYFMRETAMENQMDMKMFSAAAVEKLKAYSWPGNVRELKNVVERFCIMSNEEEISAETVSRHLKEASTKPVLEPIQVAGNLKSAREDFERNYIIQALRQNDRNISRAARFLGMERTNLHRKVKTLGIELDKI